MTYTVAALIGAAAAVVIDLCILKTRLVTRRVWWVSYAITVGFQLLINGILTGRRIVIYRADQILGWRIAYAPVEDLLFGFALVLLTVAIWVWLGRRGLDRNPRAGSQLRRP